MILKNLRLAFITFKKNKINTISSILGLVIGITTFLILMQHKFYHESYDKHFKDSDRIYRVATRTTEKNGEVLELAINYNATGRDLLLDFEELEDYTYSYNEAILIGNDEKKFGGQNVLWVDKNFLNFFGSIELLNGANKNALDQPNRAFISETAAQRFFGDKDPVGEVLRYDADLFFEIKGVFKDIPDNTHFKADYLISIQPTKEDTSNFGRVNYEWPVYNLYVKSRPNVKIEVLESKISDFIQKRLPVNITKSSNLTFFFQPIEDIHLKSNIGNEMKVNYSDKTVNLIGILAIFILIVSYINFINIYFSQSFKELREVGVRKVLGANFFNILGKSIVATLLINVIAAILIFLIINVFNLEIGAYLGDKFFLNGISKTSIWTLLGLLVAFGTIIPSLYITLILFSNSITNSLHNKFSSKQGKVNSRVVLVIFQFVITIIMVTGTLAINKQVNYMLDKDLGFKAEQVVFTSFPRSLFYQKETLESRFREFKNRIEKIAGVESVTWSDMLPGKPPITGPVLRKKGEPSIKNISYESGLIDSEYIKTYGLELVAGRNFAENQTAEDNKIMLNETARKKLGFESNESAIGEVVTTRIENSTQPNSLSIIGVVKDFHSQGLRKSIAPMLFMPDRPVSESFYAIKIKSSNLSKVVAEIGDVYEDVNPKDAYNAFFLDDFFNKQYEHDLVFKKVMITISVIIILLTCLGMFAMVNGIIRKRLKEVAVRKVNGAKLSDLLILLNKQFLIFLLITSIFAIPLAYLFIRKWLENFVYKTDLNIWVFLIPVLLIAAIVLITTSYRIALVYKINPIKVLNAD
jgi:putative ABC transport system permease protein